MNERTTPAKVIRRGKEEKRQAQRESVIFAFASALDEAIECEGGIGTVLAEVKVLNKGIRDVNIKYVKNIFVP